MHQKDISKLTDIYNFTYLYQKPNASFNLYNTKKAISFTFVNFSSKKIGLP